MVATTHISLPCKSSDKIATGKGNRVSKHSVSPNPSPSVTSEEILALRAKNQVLTDALKAIVESAEAQLQQKYDLVWFAKYRYRYPNHEASERIDSEYKREIEKLRSDDGDFYHGFNSGVLASARMFKEKADILHINQHTSLSPDLIVEATRHAKKIEEARKRFPEVDVSNDFPHLK